MVVRTGRIVTLHNAGTYCFPVSTENEAL